MSQLLINANQANENDNNKNRSYQQLDKRIKDTYVQKITVKRQKFTFRTLVFLGGQQTD